MKNSLKAKVLLSALAMAFAVTSAQAADKEVKGGEHKHHVIHSALEKMAHGKKGELKVNMKTLSLSPSDMGANININGMATKEVVPDTAHILFKKEYEGKNLDEVLQALSKSVNDAMSALGEFKDKGIVVKTNSFGYTKRYIREEVKEVPATPTVPNSPEEKVGTNYYWMGTATVSVSTDNSELPPEIMKKVSPHMNVNDISFSISHKLKQQTEKELLVEAMNDFKEKAETVVKTFNKKGYELVQLNVGGGYVEGVYAPKMMRLAAAAPMDYAPNSVDVSAGQERVRMSVDGMIRLKGKHNEHKHKGKHTKEKDDVDAKDDDTSDETKE